LLAENAFKVENVDVFMKAWTRVWTFGIGVLTLVVMAGSFKLLGLSAGFLGMILGWSLQILVAGIAA
jgi:predicted benzoate:H+ symporter BenE